MNLRGCVKGDTGEHAGGHKRAQAGRHAHAGIRGRTQGREREQAAKGSSDTFTP